MRRLLLLATVLLGGCGYFNSMYNANRSFAEAERARTRGDDVVSRRAYTESIEKAAVSYRRYPGSRWADDALLIIGRARFQLGEDRQAVAALRQALDRTIEPDARAIAHAYLGAALARLDSGIVARPHLDSAVASLPDDHTGAAIARRWRARAAFTANDTAAAWRDVDAAMRSPAMAFAAALEAAAYAIERRDSSRLRYAFEHVAAAPFAGTSAERVNRLLRDGARDWSPAAVLHASAPLDEARWQPSLVDAVALERARLAAETGDTATAFSVAQRLTAAPPAVANSARLIAARIMLVRATDVGDLDDVRELLVPAFADPTAVALQRSIRALQLLAGRGSTPATALSLFAAAEMARDEIGAREVARTLFLRFAGLAASTPWAGKAVLAAHEIRAATDSEDALRQHQQSPYLVAVFGAGPPAELQIAEDRLARGLAGLRTEALADAVQRDVIVGRAISVLDSTRVAARSDSVRIACGTLVDSLAIRGIRADSTRVACLRGDTTRVRLVLAIDTTLLRDTTAAARADVPRRDIPLPDTIPLR